MTTAIETIDSAEKKWDYFSNGVGWTEAQEQQLTAEREERKKEWARFQADGTLPKYVENADGLTADDFADLIATMYENSEARMPGVPIVHNVDSDGVVTITAGDDDLRRVVIQPLGLIAMEFAPADFACKLADAYNEKRGGKGCYAEAIDYREVYRRARAAGF